MCSQPWSVPEVVRPLYESSAMVAQKMSMAVQHHELQSLLLLLHGTSNLWTDFFCCCKIQALRYLRQVAHEDTHSVITGWGRQPAALRALSQKLTRLGSWTVPTECWWFLSWIFFSNSRTSSFTFSEVSMKLSMGLLMMDGLWLKVMEWTMFVSLWTHPRVKWSTTMQLSIMDCL